MKFLYKFYFAATLLGGVYGPIASARAQSSTNTASESAGYAEGVVATVGKRKITRRDVVATAAAYEPKIAGEALLARYPELDRVMTLDVDALCRSAFESGTTQFDNVVERLLTLNALEEAAEKRGIKITAEEVDAQTHRELETRRRGLQLPEAPDAELARKLGDSLYLLRRTARELLLKKSLILADLNDRLGHPLETGDYYSVHALFTRVNDAQGILDPKATLEKIRRQRSDVINQKRTFEDAAKAESQDASRGRGGDFGPLPRKLLKNEIDAALGKLQPGEVTEPIKILGGYAIFRLDKRGAELTDVERKIAIATYLKNEKRGKNAIAKAVQDIYWTTTIGKTPEWLKLSDEADNVSSNTKSDHTASSKD